MNKTICDACYKDCDSNSLILNIKRKHVTINNVETFSIEKKDRDLCHSCAIAINDLLVNLGRKK